MDQQDQKISCFKECFTLNHLSDDVLKELASSAILRNYRKGEFILQEGDPPNFFQLIQKGRAKIFKQTTSGKDFIIGVMSPGQALNATVLVEGRPHFVSAQAMEATTVIRIRRQDYLDLLDRHPSIALRVIATLNKVINSHTERLVDMVGEQATQRVCNILYMLQEKFGDELCFTREELADLAGMASETVIRVLTKLKAHRVIRSAGRGKLRIVDHGELKSLSRGPFYI